MNFVEVLLAIIIAFVLAVFSVVAIIWLIGRKATKTVRKVYRDGKAVCGAINNAGKAIGSIPSKFKTFKGNFKKKEEHE